MRTIGRLAREHGLSRSTLLYYDRIGLLRPSGNAKGEYRRYSAEDAARLARICEYRKAGMALRQIGRILDDPAETILAEALEERLQELNEEMAVLRSQQRFVAGLLGRCDLLAGNDSMDRETWVSLLVAAGFSEADMDRWHADFERTDPEKHERFLRMLNIPDSGVRAIRDAATALIATRNRSHE